LEGWWRTEEWRGDATYPQLILENLANHKADYMDKEVEGVNMELVSHDNAFLSFPPSPFTQRTLLAR
jgi:hypothetical protein